MANTTIKIVSNPYTKSVEFWAWNGDWMQVSQSSDPDSDLLRKEFREGFFPFKAKSIVDAIDEEYGLKRPLTIVFEGTDDEFEELDAVCSLEEYGGRLTAERAVRTLPNARDVLPDIMRLFNGIRPLVDESVMDRQRVAADLEKFYDASTDLIPLCILGNYSAGKSTFINALIGYELLPSGAQPVTAKVFQITRSKQRDRAHISFMYGGREVNLQFRGDGLVHDRTLDGVPLYDKLLEELDRLGALDMLAHMNKTIQLLNERRTGDTGNAVSDLVKIETPFNPKDPWTQDNEFVIFDTPGSNSASNLDHGRVLRDAVEGLSNGMPIYVAEHHTLDSTDNEKLYDEIKDFDAIDERFAMIVVNKADSAELPEDGFSPDEEQDVLDKAIPRHLYSQGIFFVSSVVGLGEKTEGDFISRNCARVFYQQKDPYSNRDNPFYTTLYRYNILPGQIRIRTVAESEACNGLLLANSGLFCIEQEIRRFAERYSAYNKCQQSLMLLRRVAAITSEVIGEARQKLEKDKASREQALERDKKALIEDIEGKASEIEQQSLDAYPGHIDSTINCEQWFVTLSRLQQDEGSLTQESQIDHSLSSAEDAADGAFRAIGDNFVGRLSDAVKSTSASSLVDAMQGLVEDVSTARERRHELGETRRSVDRQAANELLERVRARFDKMLGFMESEVDYQSKGYWRVRSDGLRNALFQIATGNTVLSEERRKELGDLIIGHPNIDFSKDTETIFVKARLERGFKLWNFVIVESEKLNLRKIESVFNEEIGRAFVEVCASIRTSHELAFRKWLNSLLETIVLNITEYNPDLRNHVELIRADAARIDELTSKLETIERCVALVEQLISWRE